MWRHGCGWGVVWIVVVAGVSCIGQTGDFLGDSADVALWDRTDIVCGAQEFPCGNTSVCLDRSLHCDGIEHCVGGEDEKGCADSHGSLTSLVKGLSHHHELRDIANYSSFENCSLYNFPPSCSCRFFSFLNCQGRDISSVPSRVEGPLTKMVLTNNSITYLSKGAFSHYKRLRIVHIEGNKIRKIGIQVFAELSSLTHLMFIRNQLERIEHGALKGLNNLQMMLLENNNLTDFNFEGLSYLTSLKVVDFTENRLDRLGIFPPLPNLFWLGLKNNKLKYIRKTTFHHLKQLEVLLLQHNVLEDIEEDSFHSLTKLMELDISFNKLTYLRPRLFLNLTNLSKLNLEFNMITYFNHDAFKDLYSLKSLHLQGMDIHNIDIELFRPLTTLEFIYFKKFLYCSYAPYVRICSPKTDGLSSTEHLLVWPILRMSVWVVALMTCAGNTVVLTWRVLSRKEDRVLSLFIKNLALADLLMGIYLLAVGAQDVSFRDRYNTYARKWMSSWHCTACGVIAMVSSEVSVFILSLITLERYRCIITNVRVVTLSSARYSLAVVWAVGFTLAIIPIVQFSQEQGFYASNGLCFPLHIDDPFLLGWEYSAFVFFGINFTAVILIIVLYVRMFLIIKKDRRSARPVISKKHEDAVLAVRFFFIVLTDCLCWIPIVIIKILALGGVTISHNLYACVVVLILPINSALNPLLYTIAAPTELRRKIEKRLEGAFGCLHRLQCIFISGSKTSTSSPLTQSLTTTESRSVSNGSILPPAALLSTSLAEAEVERCHLTCYIREKEASTDI